MIQAWSTLRKGAYARVMPILRYITPELYGNWEEAYIKQNAGTDENEDRHNNINNKLYRQVGSMTIKLPVRNQGCP